MFGFASGATSSDLTGTELWLESALLSLEVAAGAFSSDSTGTGLRRVGSSC